MKRRRSGGPATVCRRRSTGWRRWPVTDTVAALITGRETVEFRAFAAARPSAGCVTGRHHPLWDLRHRDRVLPQWAPAQSRGLRPRMGGRDLRDRPRGRGPAQPGTAWSSGSRRRAGAAPNAVVDSRSTCRTVSHIARGRDELAPLHGGFAPRITVSAQRGGAGAPGSARRGGRAGGAGRRRLSRRAPQPGRRRRPGGRPGRRPDRHVRVAVRADRRPPARWWSSNRPPRGGRSPSNSGRPAPSLRTRRPTWFATGPTGSAPTSSSSAPGSPGCCRPRSTSPAPAGR